MKGVPWTRDDIIVAYALYCITPLSKINMSNQTIKDVADIIHHSKGSLILRMQNFRYIDPKAKSGMAHVAKTDVLVYNEFKNDWGSLSVKAENLTGLALFDASPEHGAKPLSSLTDRSKTTRERAFFKKAVAANYNGACCITGVSTGALLIASHIKPYWRCRTEQERTTPENGLLLNAIHDMAFDKGYITIDKKLRIHVSTALNDQRDNDFIRFWFSDLEGCRIACPSRFAPNPRFLEYHNDEVFLG